MDRDANIVLNIDSVGPEEAREEVSRLIVASGCGYTRDGGAPTITDDCTNQKMLEREGARLKSEIDAALARAREHYGTNVAPARTSPKRHKCEEQPGHPMPRLSTNLAVREVMTRDVRTMDQNAMLSVADELMKVGNFRHVVVLDSDDRVAGVISRRDIFHGALAWSLGQGEAAHAKMLASYPAKQVMSTDVIFIDPDVTLSQAAALMREHRVGCLPVIDGTKLVGIVTEGDFLALLAGS